MSLYRPVTIGPLALDGNVFFAPLSGVSTSPVRKLAREFGANLVYSEMIKAQGVVHGNIKSRHYLEMDPDEHPVGVQLADADPKALVEAAHAALDRGADLIDLNCGCPVKKVVKTECGAALLKDPPLIGRIIRELRAAVPDHIPVTLKIRVGWDGLNKNGPHVAKIAEDNGAAAVTVHGRTREQLYSGRVDLEMIAKVKAAVSIPVIGNGDILTPEDAKRMLETTGCDGVMVGRGAVGNPWLFGRIRAHLEGRPAPEPGVDEKRKGLVRMLALLCASHGDYTGVRMMRKFVGWFTHGVPGGKRFRGDMMEIEDPAVLAAFIDARFGVRLGGLDEDEAPARVAAGED
jgi:tRNA-dihydrouridine synthase B